MKILRLFIFLICFFACFLADAQTSVQFIFNNAQYSVSQYTNVQVILQPEQLNASGSVTILQPKIYQYTDTNASTTFSNLAGNYSGGYYHWTVPAFTSADGFNPPVTSQGDIQITSTNLGLVSSTSVGVTFTPVYNGFGAAWTAQASDLRYSQSSNNLSSYVQIGQLLSTSNGIVALIPSTNGFVASFITNGLATTNFVINATNGLATPAITNGLAGTNLLSAYTLTNQFIYGTNWVSTNALAQIQGTNAILTALIQTASNALSGFINSSSNALQFTKQPASLTLSNLSSTGAFTNGLSAGQNVSLTTNGSGTIISINATNQTFLTNGITQTAFQPLGFYLGTNSLPTLTNGFVSSTVTNGLATIGYVNLAILSSGGQTNGLGAGLNVSLTTNISGNITFINATNQTFLTNGLGQWVGLQPSAYLGTNALPGLTNGFITTANLSGYATTGALASAISAANINTNQYASGQNLSFTTNISGSIIFINATNQIFLTNGLASQAFVGTSIAASNLLYATANQLGITSNALASAILNSTNAGNIVFTNNSIWTNLAANGFNYVASTNGTATFPAIQGGLIVGTKTNILWWTNSIGIGANGSGMSGTYLGSVNSATWTNVFNSTNTIIYSAGNYYLQSNGVSMYQSANVAAWTLVNGINPVPLGWFGAKLRFTGDILDGWIYSTNLTWQITNAIAVLSPTNSGGGTTNFILSGFVGSWTTNNALTLAGTNTINALAYAQAVLVITNFSGPTNGITSAMASNIVLNYGGTLYQPIGNYQPATANLTNWSSLSTNVLSGAGGSTNVQQVFFTPTNPFSITASMPSIAFNTNGCMWINRNGVSNNWLNIITNN